MKARLEEIMYEVAIDTLEKLAFMFAFPGDEGDWSEDSMLAGKISFTGPFSGIMVMTISKEVLQELTVNMLGLDDGEETAEKNRSDALKETLNVICGNLLPAIVGDGLFFDIGVPEVLPSDKHLKRNAGIPDGVDPSAKVDLAFDEGQCILFLFLDGKIPEEFVSS